MSTPMTVEIFVFAVLALLVTPGPTNTLLALGGAAQGPRAALRLLPAELLGYLAAVVPLSLLRLWFDPSQGPAGLVLHVGAALWVGWLALKIGLGSLHSSNAAPAVTPRLVLTTTLLNPKVLIFALLLLPLPATPGWLAHLALFAALVPLIGFGWLLVGALIGRQGSGGLWLRRLAALWLGALAIMLAQGAIAAA